MIQTITESMFINEMRAIRPDNFSYEGLQELFSYLDEIDSNLEFDPIAICCDFSQCSLREFKDAFPAIEGIMIDEGLTLEDSIQYYIEENGYWFAFIEGGQEIVFNNF
jgi:secreted Zn-dependent insulinase-like peptidase